MIPLLISYSLDENLLGMVSGFFVRARRGGDSDKQTFI